MPAAHRRAFDSGCAPAASSTLAPAAARVFWLYIHTVGDSPPRAWRGPAMRSPRHLKWPRPSCQRAVTAQSVVARAATARVTRLSVAAHGGALVVVGSGGSQLCGAARAVGAGRGQGVAGSVMGAGVAKRRDFRDVRAQGYIARRSARWRCPGDAEEAREFAHGGAGFAVRERSKAVPPHCLESVAT